MDTNTVSYTDAWMLIGNGESNPTVPLGSKWLSADKKKSCYLHMCITEFALLLASTPWGLSNTLYQAHPCFT